MRWKRSLPCPQCGEEIDLAILERLLFRLRLKDFPSCPSCGRHVVYPLGVRVAGSFAGMVAVLIPLGLLHSAGWWNLSTARGFAGAGLLFPVFYVFLMLVVNGFRRTIATHLEEF